jgi:hypothetical protein
MGINRPVQVRIARDSKVIAVKTVTGNHRFNFTEPAGWYVLSSDQPYVKPVRFLVVHAMTAEVNLPSNCK